ncbi:hypothetical protein SAMN03159475_4855 [Pseudomonas sp. NFPP33]|nr:hypothetical protein [Pseudomonas sp. NFPP33]SDA83701.1 hypothetical protein SAMN03159475_4855 [Pseudomonas sp. NFPP33]
MTSTTPRRHIFTINQHVFPVAGIMRFYSSRKCVQVFDKVRSKTFPSNAKNDLFCAKRVWDERTERTIGKSIEDAFQRLAKSIIEGRTNRLGLLENDIIGEFWSLWRTRHGFKKNGLPDLAPNGVAGDDLSDEQEETLEAKGVIYTRRDGTVPGRLLAGIHVLMYHDAFWMAERNIRWGIVRSAEGEFIVPDTFNDLMAVPIAPNLMLLADQEDCWMSRDEVAVINRCAIQRAESYYFARDLGKCPVITEAPFSLKRRFIPDNSIY